jgi:hypothetical protein
MSALALSPNLRVDPPATLPVEYLSVSSLNLFERCPESWRRKYIEHQYEPPSGKMLLGGAAGAAEAQHYGLQIERGEGLVIEDVLDEFSAQLDDRASREEVDWQGEQPGALKDSGVGALRIYHAAIAPTVTPVSVEREFSLSWEGAPFTLTGYLDLEDSGGAVCDLKMSKQRWSEDKARAELQPTVYLAARRAEGNPAPEFQYHTMIRTAQPKAEVVPTIRTERQLDLLTTRIFSIAREIEWRWLNDCWRGTAPDLAWMCRGCGFASSCPWSRA